LVNDGFQRLLLAFAFSAGFDAPRALIRALLGDNAGGRTILARARARFHIVFFLMLPENLRQKIVLVKEFYETIASFFSS
jgi:hypothetical protein